MEFYHIDKNNSLTEGQLLQFRSIDPNYKIAELFPEGLSAFGQDITGLKYKPTNTLLENFSMRIDWQCMTMLNVELIFELVRQKYFSHLPSRFQCIFATDEINLPHWKKVLSNNSNAHLVELSIEHDNYCKLDASFLTGGLGTYNDAANIQDGPYFYSVERFLKNAWHYWSGEASDKPEWEFLITPPAKVIRIIR